MALEDIPVWFIPPNWAGKVIETLEWLTSVLASENGAEQRISLRPTPRRFFEMQFSRAGSDRSVLDMMLHRIAGGNFYLPIWHDANLLNVAAVSGSSVIELRSPDFTEFDDCPGIFIKGSGLFDYEIAQFSSRVGNEITINGTISSDWPKNTRVFPLQKVQVENVSTLSRLTAKVFDGRVKFRVANSNPCSFVIELPTFNDQWVLEREPNAIDDLTFEYQRLMRLVDDEIGLRQQRDMNLFAATIQKFSFFSKYRQDNSWLRSLFYTLQGRRYPIFLPTFMKDIDPIETLSGSDILARRGGFTDFDAPFRGRQFIQVKLQDGSLLYRRTIGSAFEGENERIQIDEAFPSDINVSHVKRISFLSLCRLEQDSVELIHETDTQGLTTATAMFRSLPQVRNPIPDPSGDGNSDDDGGGDVDVPEPDLIYCEFKIIDTGGGSEDGNRSVCLGLAGSSFQIDDPWHLNVNADGPEMADGVFWHFRVGGDGVGWGYPTRAAAGPFNAALNDVIGMWIDRPNSQLWTANITHDPTLYLGDGGGVSPNPVARNNGHTFGPAGKTPITGNFYLLIGVGRDGTGGAPPVIDVNTNGPFDNELLSGYFPAGDTVINPDDIALPSPLTDPPKIILSNGNKRLTGGVIPGPNQPTAFGRSVKSWSHG